MNPLGHRFRQSKNNVTKTKEDKKMSGEILWQGL